MVRSCPQYKHVLDMNSMQIKLIGIRASALGHRIKPLANASAATIVGVGAGEKKNRMIRAAMRHLQLTRIDPKSVGYAYSYGYGHGYGYGDLGGSIPMATPAPPMIRSA